MRVLVLLHAIFFAAPAPVFAQQVATPTAASESPATSNLAEQAWQLRYRRLRAQTGVSWSLMAIGVLGMAIPIAQLAASRSGSDQAVEPDAGFGAIIAIPIFAALTAAALVPAIMYTDRLVEHRRRRPAHARLHLTPGGVVLRF